MHGCCNLLQSTNTRNLLPTWGVWGDSRRHIADWMSRSGFLLLLQIDHASPWSALEHAYNIMLWCTANVALLPYSESQCCCMYYWWWVCLCKCLFVRASLSMKIASVNKRFNSLEAAVTAVPLARIAAICYTCCIWLHATKPMPQSAAMCIGTIRRMFEKCINRLARIAVICYTCCVYIVT